MTVPDQTDALLDPAAHRLHYGAPATEWTDALPLGNGRIGAMCFGTHPVARYQVNDATAWSGSPASEASGRTSHGASAAALEVARGALGRGDYPAADRAVRTLQGRYSQSYQPFVDLMIQVDAPGEVTEYTRALDLASGVHTHRYRSGVVTIEQRAVVSSPAQALVIHMETDAPVTITAWITTMHRRRSTDSLGGVLAETFWLPSDGAPGHEPDQQPVRYDDNPETALQGAALLALDTDGKKAIHDGRFSVKGATRATLVLTTATTFAGIGRRPLISIAKPLSQARDRLSRVLDKGWEATLAEHIDDHGALYRRAALTLGTGDSEEFTDLRLARVGSGVLTEDPQLFALLFHYGRYLLIASSRPGTPPANLQGIWNDDCQPPWSANYTANINLQMNYWLAEVTDLGDLHAPLFDLVRELSVRGRETALRLYGSQGWVCHHNTDVWAFTSPVGMGRGDNSWAWWPMAGVWLVAHLKQHLDFGAGDEFARDVAWDIATGAARFVLDWCEFDARGTLISPISTSPENTFRAPDRSIRSVARGSAIDHALSREVLSFVVELGERLGRNGDIVDACSEAVALMAPIRIGADGRLAEWDGGLEDVDVGHRHVSHLYPVFPGTERIGGPVAAAAAASLDHRGDESTGWSLVWKAALWARLGDGERAARLLTGLFRPPNDGRAEWAGALYPSLLQSNPPFQIDANFGFTAAVAEMLVQSHRGMIEVLPAIGRGFPDGSVSGLVARPGVKVDLEWCDGKPTRVVLTALADCTMRLVWRGKGSVIALVAGLAHEAEIGDWSAS